MANISRNFIAGKMNKVLDQRIIPDGEYVDAMNIRMGSTENSEVGVIENTKGNLNLTTLAFNGHILSANARCIGAIQDSANETIYWFVHDPSFTSSNTGKLDLIVSYNIFASTLTYNVISIDDGGHHNTTLNFNPSYLITGVNILNDLLFFTDDYNPPRFININPISPTLGSRYPNPVGGIDKITAEALLVIKKPPVQSPTIQPFVTNGQENYLDTRFICFAYRYQYIDGEYSATSQWSEPAFIPKDFSFSRESYLNEGMTNFCNAVNVTYNTGGPLVVGVDLLFKQSENNIIKVIEKLDKSNLGLVDNTNYTFVFKNSKIFTILSEAELLRLYDNVPRFAKAQTIMGNRLMYGNYIEGYDLVDNLGKPIRFTYTTKLSTIPIGTTDITDSTANGTYNINTFQIVGGAVVTFDLTGAKLVSGSSLSFNITIEHDRFTGQTPYPTETTTSVTLNFPFFLVNNYTSVYQLATSVEFQNAIGTISNIKTVVDSCSGSTFTDLVNCELPNNLGSNTKIASGINAINEPVGIITSPASNVIGLQFPAMRYVNNVLSPTKTFYEYYKVLTASAIFQEIANPQSLHSNRDYEIGIVYMDEYNRATTALVSPHNTVHVPCGNSDTQNSIQVTIPTSQKPPVWATRYKFVIKPDQENYETIYSSIFFEDPLTNNAYFLLEGENARKVETGDRFIVKADSDGPTSTCTYATVLEKSSQDADFFEIFSPLDPTVKIPIPAGVYMKMNPNSFSIVTDPLAIIAPGKIEEVRHAKNAPGPVLNYPMNYQDTTASTETWVDYDVPSGSKIRLVFKQNRAGYGNTGCEERTSELDKTIVASKDYENMYAWWVGDNVAQYLNQGHRYAGEGCTPTNEFIPAITNDDTTVPTDICINYYQFYRNLTTNKLDLCVTGTDVCNTSGHYYSRASSVTVNIEVFRSKTTIVFETQPSDALPDVFFENELSLPITNGNHMGNIQNQTLSVPAIIDTQFFNCFAFGNGVESYKIRDSIIGRPFNFGNRVTAVAAQTYKAADRFSDITYSGIYNAESNINKLNEFNLGLLNYKHLETSFGEIFVMDGRETDVLVLQEDKISYVLASKNLLSDASAGGVVTATPEVLGTQIARTEKYGISFNPESYVHWGYDRFFTDVKRGAVIQLRGNSYSNEELKVVSDSGMRTWFRDNFNDTFSYQKLGGYDPYMNEYILSTNNISLPINPQCLACGVSQTFTLSTTTGVQSQLKYCVDLGPTVGLTDVVYNVSPITEAPMLFSEVSAFSEVGDFEVIATYNGTSVSSGWVSEGGTITFNKNATSIETAEITINYTKSLSLDVTAECCQNELLSIVQVVLTNNTDAGDTVHTQYNYTEPIGTFVSPVQSTFVSFVAGSSNPLVSLYSVITAPMGTGSIPSPDSVVTMYSNKFATDTFVFDSLTDKFKYYRSNTLYENNSADLNALLTASSTATPITNVGDVYSSEFTLPLSGDYLYLVWDFRESTATELCVSETTTLDACCGCGGTPSEVLCYSSVSQVDSCCGCGIAPSETLCYSNISQVDSCCGCTIAPSETFCYSNISQVDSCCGC